MKRLITLFVLVLLTSTLNASAVIPQGYEFQTVVAVPCGGDLPSDLCTSVGDAIAQTSTLLGSYSAQGWEVVSTSPMRYATGNDGVVFLLGRNPAIRVALHPKQFHIIMGMSCGQGPNGLPFSQLCTASGASLTDVLNAHTSLGWKVTGATSCTYRYEEREVGMAVYVVSK